MSRIAVDAIRCPWPCGCRRAAEITRVQGDAPEPPETEAARRCSRPDKQVISYQKTASSEFPERTSAKIGVAAQSCPPRLGPLGFQQAGLWPRRRRFLPDLRSSGICRNVAHRFNQVAKVSYMRTTILDRRPPGSQKMTAVATPSSIEGMDRQAADHERDHDGGAVSRANGRRANHSRSICHESG
jgi:hypothetical protein